MFRDRQDAGKRLSALLDKYRGQDVIIYGLTRGGVPVAYEIAMALNAPLEALIVKKLGAPHQEELALGAIVEGEEPVIYYNRELLSHMQLHENDLNAIVERKKEEILELQRILRPNRKMLLDRNKIAIIVDDGIATGSTMKAAIDFFRKLGQRSIVVAVPMGQNSVLNLMRKSVNEVVCSEAVGYMEAVGEFYSDFRQVESSEVARILNKRELSLHKAG